MAVVRDPALVWNPLPEHDQQAGITPYQWIVHTFVDGPFTDVDEMQDYFETGTTLESHTLLGWSEHQQLMDFDRRADANYKANRYLVGTVWRGAISTETEDDGTPLEKPWNAFQLAELIRFGTWLARTFGIPPYLPTVWNGPGMGYHCLFPDFWTNVPGKICPGHLRIGQFTGTVLPAIRKNLAPVPEEDEDDMPTTFAWFKDPAVPGAAEDNGAHLYALDGAKATVITKEAYEWARDVAAFGGGPAPVKWNDRSKPWLVGTPPFQYYGFLDGPLEGR